jgi:hypothetical protein
MPGSIGSAWVVAFVLVLIICHRIPLRNQGASKWQRVLLASYFVQKFAKQMGQLRLRCNQAGTRLPGS